MIRLAALLSAALWGAQFSGTPAAQPWPERPVRIVVPFALGGIADTAARNISERLGARLGEPVLIENRPGAAGNLGAETVARSAPDGHTLLLGYDGTMVVNPHVYPRPGFDTLLDFAPVTKLGDAGVLLVAHPSLPAKDLRELIALGRTSPGMLAYGSAGTGTTAHLACELLSQRSGAALVHVPYKDGGRAVADVLGGQIPLLCTAVAGANQFMKQGRLRGLGLSSVRRAAGAPGVPTFAESGLPGLVVNSWVGILAPARTPRAIVDRLYAEITVLLQTPELRERFGALGIEPVGNTPGEFAAQIRADLERWGPVVKQANIRVE